LTFDATMGHCAARTVSLANVVYDTHRSADGDSQTTGSSTSATVDLVGDGFTIGAGIHDGTTATASWDTLTESDDATLESAIRYSFAQDLQASDAASTTITITWAGTAFAGMHVVSFR